MNNINTAIDALLDLVGDYAELDKALAAITTNDETNAGLRGLLITLAIHFDAIKHPEIVDHIFRIIDNSLGEGDQPIYLPTPEIKGELDA